MKPFAPWRLVMLAWLAGSPSYAAEIGVATLVQGESRMLRGTTWYKLVPGARLEDGDIVAGTAQSQINIEFGQASVVNLSGPGTLYLEPLPAKPVAKVAGVPAVSVSGGWLKADTKSPGIRLRTAAAEIAIVDGVVVMRNDGSALDVFMESGSARLTQTAGSSADAAMRETRSGEFWSKLPGAALAVSDRPPKSFIDGMPRHYFDALPHLQDRFKIAPALVGEREISYGEAEPWLAGPHRAIFERRFIGRLRDRTFRNDVFPHVARYPSWDRRLNPQKFAPKPKPQPQPQPATRP